MEVNYFPGTKILNVNLDLNPSAVKQGMKMDQLITLNNCKWIKINSESIGPDKIRLFGKASCLSASNKLNLVFPNFDQFPRNYQIIGRLFVDGDESTFLLNQTTSSLTFNFSKQKTISSFIMMGIEHIGVTPEQWNNRLPDGIDHILFVLALILLGGGIKNTIKIVSGFTLGHSISLILASFNLISIPGSIIEPMIALSIVYVAIEALIIKQSSHRWKVACFFGIVHGFGFASALRDLHLSGGKLITALVGFNLGVECGQVVIILAVLPFLNLLARRPVVFNFTNRLASMAIALIGSYWFVVRVMG